MVSRLPRRTVLAATWLVLCALLAGLAVWQWREYQQECSALRQTVHGQAEALHNALVGGIRSHRRLGLFFEEQLQGALDELVRSENVLAAAVISEDGRLVVRAGQANLIDPGVRLSPGVSWEPWGVRHVGRFRLEPVPAGPARGGWGFGRGRGRGPSIAEEPETLSPFAQGGWFCTVLVLDRQATDAACHRAGWLRWWVGLASGLVVVCSGVAFLVVVWWMDLRARANLLEAEAQHLRDLSQAAAGLAHETRNPLSLIRGWSQRLAESGLGSADQSRQAQAIVEECDRVASRINQFLAFAKPCQPKPERFDPDAVIAELASLLAPDLETRRLKLVHDRGAVPRPIRADREMFRQALFNLLRNAIEFSPEGETVEIRVVRGQDGGSRVEVVDRGPGVPAEHIPMLFTPYFTTRPEGTGLGLAMVRRMASAHGWQTGYTPRAQGGSIFWLDRIHAG